MQELHRFKAWISGEPLQGICLREPLTEGCSSRYDSRAFQAWKKRPPIHREAFVACSAQTAANNANVVIRTSSTPVLYPLGDHVWMTCLDLRSSVRGSLDTI